MSLKQLPQSRKPSVVQSVEGQQPSWVYDIVVNKADKIIAMCFHPAIPFQLIIQPHTDCLSKDKKVLEAEGLRLELSSGHATLQDAKASAWKLKDMFDKGLD